MAILNIIDYMYSQLENSGSNIEAETEDVQSDVW